MESISRTPSIYQIRHIESGRVYVGSAVDPRHRCNEHRSRLSRGVHSSRYLQRTWNKYSEDAFVFEIIEPVLFTEDLITREQYWIDTLRAADRRYGFNVMSMANSAAGVKRTNETRQRLSAAKRAEFSDPNARARLAEQSRAYWARPESREKMRVKKQRDAVNPEIRAKMSASQRAYVAAHPELSTQKSERQRAFYQNNPDARKRAADAASIRVYILTDSQGGIHETRNLMAFCQEHGLVARNLHDVMRGIRPYHKGWTCRRKED